MLKEEAKEEIVSASHAKILTKQSQDRKRTEDSEVLWQALTGRTIVSGKTLAEMLEKMVRCGACQADVTLLENVNCKSSLGSTWIVNCSNEQCPSISVDTGKVVDVVHMCSFSMECEKMVKKREDGQVSHLDYLSWFQSHEENCYLNLEGSSAVSFCAFVPR